MSEKKTAIIIGLGAHARASWLKQIRAHPDWELIGVVDTDTELLENVTKLCPELDEDQAYISIDHAVQFGPKPDLAVVATPIYTHHVLVKETMDHGINVICEKNMASTIYQGRQLLQLALDHPELSTGMGFQRRYTSSYWTAKKFLQTDANEIGELNFIRWTEAFNWGLYREGWRQWLQELYAEDQFPHWADLLRWVTGLDVVQVKADLFIPRGSDWQGSASLVANLALAHPDDYHHRHNWVWCQFYGDWQRRGPNLDLREFSGSRGRFTISPQGWGLETLLYQDPEGKRWEEDGYLPQHDIEFQDWPYEQQGHILEEMKRSIDSGGREQPGTNFRHTFKSFAVTMAVIEASRTGRTIWVPDYWRDMPI